MSANSLQHNQYKVAQPKTMFLALCALGGFLLVGFTLATSYFTFPLKVYRTIHFDEAGSVWSVAWSPDSQKLATAIGYRHTTTIWDVNSGKKLKVLKNTGVGENSLFFLPGNQLLTSSFDDPNGYAVGSNALSIWDISRGQVVQNIPGPFAAEKTRNHADHFAISADGSLAAGTTMHGDYAALYSLKDSHTLQKWVFGEPRGPQETMKLTLSPDGKYLAIIKLGELCVFNVSDGTKLRSTRVATGMISALAFSPDSQLLASSVDLTGDNETDKNGERLISEPDHAVTVWKVSDGSVVAAYPAGQAHNVEQISWAPDSQSLAFTAWSDSTVRIWSPDKPNDTGIILKFGMPFPFVVDPRAVISPDGKYLAVVVHANLKIFILPETSSR